MKTALLHLAIWVLLTGCEHPTAFLLGNEFEYRLSRKANLIFFEGGIDFGLVDDLSALIQRYSDVDGIVLDSYGGRVYAARDAARLIRQHQLNTYAPKSCKSVCTILFLAGKNRYLGKNAAFYFHRYDMISSDIDRFEKQGVSTEFLNQLAEELKRKEWVHVSNTQALNAGIVVEQPPLAGPKAAYLPPEFN